MRLSTLPVFERLADAKSVLIAGAGGGFDVFAGLPLYFALRGAGIQAHLANLSFTRLDEVDGRRPSPTVVEVRPETSGPASYFPERHLARWLAEHGYDPRVFAFDKTGVVPLRRAYRALIAELAADAIVLVDGGSDILLRGDEVGLGTPGEDMASLAAVDDLDLGTKLVLSLGFGVDAYHGVSHGQVLEAVAELTKSGGFLGAFSLLPGMPEAQLYRAAVDAVNAATPEMPSIVNASIVSAIDGDFGDVHRTERTRGSRLWINPLMALYFAFDLSRLARRVQYLPMLKHTQTMFEISARIEGYQRGCEALRPRMPIPI